MEGVVYDLHVLSEGLTRLGHKVYAIDPGRESEEAIPPRDVSRVFPGASVELRSPQIPNRRVANFQLNRTTVTWELYKAYRRYVEINRFLEQEKVDLIVLYSAVRLGAQTVHLAKKHKVPVVFRNVDKLYNLWPTRTSRAVARQLEKRVYPRVDRLLALTPKYAEYLIRFGGARSKTSLLLFPIDTKLFHPSVDCSIVRQRWGLKEDDQIITFIGTLYPFGGLVEFTRQLPAVLKEVPRAKLLIVGDGPIRGEIEATIAELKLENHVVLTGYQPFDDMPQYVSAATVCLNAFPINNRTNDIFSAKIVQYLSCGKPTVSSALPGIMTLLESQKCGVIYTASIEALGREIVQLMKSPERRQELGEIGRRYIEQNHSYEHVIASFEGELKQMLSQRKG